MTHQFNIATVGEHRQRYLIKHFIDHHLTERPRQGIGNWSITPKTLPGNDNAMLGRIGRRSRLGDLLNFYCGRAA